MQGLLGALDLDGLQFAVLIGFMLIAAIARGYAGFGSSAIVMAGASLVIPPDRLVPVLYMLEVAASVRMFPSICDELDYGLFWPMVAGTIVGIPIGQLMLTELPADTVRILLALVVLACALLLWRGYRFGRAMTRPLALATGVVTGIGSGLAVIGGLIMVIILLATDFPATKTRAMCIAIFLVMYFYGTGVAALNGLISMATIWTVIVVAIPLAVGLVIGQRQYLLTSPERFRQFILVFLVALALVGIVRALVI